MCKASTLPKACVAAFIDLMDDGTYSLLITGRPFGVIPNDFSERYDRLTLPEVLQVIDLETARYYADPF